MLHVCFMRAVRPVLYDKDSTVLFSCIRNLLFYHCAQKLVSFYLGWRGEGSSGAPGTLAWVHPCIFTTFIM